MKVIVINPTYNEKENIEKLIHTLEDDIFPHIKNHEIHILVADDNSPDGTADIVKNLMKKYKNLHIVQGEKQGLGAAYIRAMTYAIEKLNADVMFEMDADGQHDPTKIPQFLEKIDKGADFVIGTRYSDGGSIPQNWPPQRKAFSIIANLFVRVVFMQLSIHDWTGGYRAIKKEVFLKEKDYLKNYNGYIFQISFLHKAIRDGYKVAEVPFHFTDRMLGKSKIAALGYIIDVVSYVVTARIKELERFIKFLVVGGTGFIVQLIMQEGAVAVGLALILGVILKNIFPQTDIAALRDGVAAALGAETAIISNFLFNNFWTFKDTTRIKERSNFFMRFIKFNLSSLAAIFIQFAAVTIAVHFLGDTLSLASVSIKTRIVVLFPTIILLVIPLNYIIYNKIIWKTQYLKNGDSKKT